MKEVNLTIDRFEDDNAVLKFENGRSISWPLTNLPENIKESEIINFKITTNKEKKETDRSIAKSILNEILNTD